MHNITSLNLIGESINDSVPSTKSLFDTDDRAGLAALAASQEAGGAAYLDVNVGTRSAEYMATICRLVQDASRLPLSVDSPDVALAESGLAECRSDRGKPILNSISLRRCEMFEMYQRFPFRPILLATESESGGCHTTQETFEAAGRLLEQALRAGVPREDCIFDLGIAPIGSDADGNLARLMQTLSMMHTDTHFASTHRSVGLSNFTVMLPAKTRSGNPVKGPLESAFLTRAVPLGLDHVIGSVKRNYAILNDGDAALACFDDCVRLAGFDAILRVRDFYAG
ncbi:MAG: dihydropteroate synthase [Thermoguttaceae bacterium]